MGVGVGVGWGRGEAGSGGGANVKRMCVEGRGVQGRWGGEEGGVNVRW